MKRIVRIVFKIIKWLIVVVLCVLLLVVIVVKVPAVHDFILDKTTHYFNEKTGGKLTIQDIDLRIPFYVQLEGISLKSPDGQRVAYVGDLEISLGWRYLLNQTIRVDKLVLKDVEARVIKKDNSGWNYDFIVDAFSDSTAATPDTTTTSEWDFSLGKIKLKNIDLAYYNYSTSDSVHAIIGDFAVRMDEFSLNKGTYLADRVALKNSAAFIRIGYSETDSAKASLAADESAAGDSTSLTLGLEEFVFKNNTILYEMGAAPDKYLFDIGTLKAQVKEINLDAQKYRVNQLVLSNANIHLKLAPVPPDTSDDSLSIFVPIDLKLAQLDVDSIDFKMETYGQPDATLKLSQVGIDLRDIVVDSTQYAGRIENIEGSYNQFKALENFSTGFKIAEGSAALSNLDLKYGQSELHANIRLKYEALDSLLGSGSFQNALVHIESLKIIPNDIRQIARGLDIPDSAIVLPHHPILLEAMARGNANQFTIEGFELSSGQTMLSVAAVASGPTWLTKDYRIEHLNLSLDRTDLQPYIEAFQLDTNYIPPKTNLSLAGKFTTDTIRFSTNMSSTYGDFTLSGNGGGYTADTLPISVKLASKSLDYAAFLGMPEPFESDLLLNASMQNILDTTNLEFMVDLKIDTLHYDSYLLNNIKANTLIDSNLYVAKILIDDTFLVANIGLSGRLDPGLSALLKAEVEGVDLQGLGLFKDDLRGKFDLSATFTQIDSTQKGAVTIDNILFVREDDRYDINPIHGSVLLSPDTTSVQVSSPFLNLTSISNQSIDELITAMVNTLGHTGVTATDSSAYWKFRLETMKTPDLYDLFIPKLTEIKPIHAKIDYSAANQKIEMDISVPKIRYASYSIDSLYITSTGSRGEIEANLHLKRAAMDTLAIKNLDFQTRTSPQGAHAELRIGGDSLSRGYFVGFNLVADSARLRNGFRVNILDSLILNREVWHVDEDNYIHYSPEGIELTSLRIFNNGSALSFQKNKEDNGTTIAANDFALTTITGVVATDYPLISGTLFGDFKILSSSCFGGQGRIENFHFSKANFGKIAWQAEKTEAGFEVDVHTGGGMLDMELSGRIDPQNADFSKIELNLDLNKFDLATLPKFLPSYFFAGKGILTGNMEVSGTTKAPQLEGEFNFNNALLGIEANGSKYAIDNQAIIVNPNAIVFNTFTVRDSSGSALKIDGKISHQNFDHVQADLTIEARNFEIASIKPSDNANYYGKLLANLDIAINGRLDAPNINAEIKISDKTKFSYVVPETDYEDPYSDNLIKWTRFDTTQTSSIITRDADAVPKKVDIYTNTIDLNGVIKINDGALFRVVIDSSAGDYLQIQGGGTIGVTYDRTGNLNLNGTYVVQDGFYQMTFYGIVKKKFYFQKGSQLTWSGDPTEAIMDITAVYKTKANVAGLMLSGSSEPSAVSFDERLPFEVVMHITGTLMKPTITFDIRVAEESRGVLGGAVEAKLADLRQNQSELNKQVFALLVLNTFISTGNSNTNFITNQARSSASQILSQQLNALSDKFIRGVDLNFNLGSYGGAAGEGNTDLSIDLEKSFMNDRVVVRIGSTIALEDNTPNVQNSQEMMTNITIEYKITPDGTYRLKVYRKNDYEDIVVGRITRTGIGLLFQHDFSRFKNIFNTTSDSSDAAKSEED